MTKQAFVEEIKYSASLFKQPPVAIMMLVLVIFILLAALFA